MNTEEEQLIKLVEAKESNIISEETFCKISAYRNVLQEKGLPIIYNLRHLRKIFKIRKREQSFFFGNARYKNYVTFYIPKKSGKWRKIEAPKDRLKSIQAWIKSEILEHLTISDYAKGFVRSVSIYDNAVLHTNKEVVLNIDLQDFFPSVKYSQVFRIFYYAGYTKEVSHLLTKLCTNNSNVLPQGAPTSPILSNIVCYKLDKRLGGLSGKMGIVYSRYADDITFSGNKDLLGIVPLIRSIIQDEGFTVNENKVRIQYSNGRQTVTGLTVNKKVTVNKELERELCNAIYYISKFGVDDHMLHINCDRAFYKEHLFGIACFINMIDGEKGERYIEQLNSLAWE